MAASLTSGQFGGFLPSHNASCALVYADPSLESEKIYIEPLSFVPERVEVCCSCCTSSTNDYILGYEQAVPVLGGEFLRDRVPLPSDDANNGGGDTNNHLEPRNELNYHLQPPFYLFHRSGRPKLYTMLHHPEMPVIPLAAVVTPSARSGHVFAALEDVMVLHAGLGEVTLGDTWLFYPSSRKWSKMDFAVPDNELPPAAYGQASAVFHPFRCSCAAHSHQSTLLHSPTVSDLNDPTTSPRPHQHLLIVGGCTAESLIDDIWVLCTHQPKWSSMRLSTPIPPLWGAAGGTMRQPRILHHPGVAPESEEKEEEVVVLYGGMLEDRLVSMMYVIHTERALTVDDVAALKELILMASTTSPLTQEEVLQLAVGSYLVETIHIPYIPSFVNARVPSVMLANPSAASTDGFSESGQSIGSSPATPLSSEGDGINNTDAEIVLPQLPRPRRRACSCVLEDHTLIIFGGRDYGAFFNDVWEWNILTRAWRVLHTGEGDSPAARTGACMSLDAERKLLYVFGGYREEAATLVRVLGDFFVYHLEGNYWERVNINKERNWHPSIDYHVSSFSRKGGSTVEHALVENEEVLSSAPIVLDDHLSRLMNSDCSQPWRTHSSQAVDPTSLAFQHQDRVSLYTSSYYNTKPTVHFPIVRPFHRTMASLLQDPLHPRRYFLFGGRLINEPRSDLIEITFESKSSLPASYHQIMAKSTTAESRLNVHNQMRTDYLEKLVEMKHEFFHNVSLSSKGLRATLLQYLNEKKEEEEFSW